MILRNRLHDGNWKRRRITLFLQTFPGLALYLCFCLWNSCMYAVITMTQETKSTDQPVDLIGLAEQAIRE